MTKPASPILRQDHMYAHCTHSWIRSSRVTFDDALANFHVILRVDLAKRIRQCAYFSFGTHFRLCVLN